MLCTSVISLQGCSCIKALCATTLLLMKSRPLPAIMTHPDPPGPLNAKALQRRNSGQHDGEILPHVCHETYTHAVGIAVEAVGSAVAHTSHTCGALWQRLRREWGNENVDVGNGRGRGFIEVRKLRKVPADGNAGYYVLQLSLCDRWKLSA